MLPVRYAMAFVMSLAASVAAAAEILAEPPSDLIVTIYRSPYRNSYIYPCDGFCKLMSVPAKM